MNSPAPSYHGYRFPPDIIAHAVWLYFRFSLSFRDVEDRLHTEQTTAYYEFRWIGTLAGLLSGIVPQKVASPRGIEPLLPG